MALLKQFSALVSHEAFSDYFIQEMDAKNKFLQCGIMATDGKITEACSRAGVQGTKVELPFWNSLDNAADASIAGVDLTPEAIGASQDVAPIVRRNKAFGADDVAAAYTGSDPLKAITSQIAGYWQKQNQKRLLKLLEGVFARNQAQDGGDLIYDAYGLTIASDTTTLASGKTLADVPVLNKNTFLDAAQLFGDRKDELVGIACHSMVENELTKIDGGSTLYKPSTQTSLASYNGRSLVVDDSLEGTKVTVKNSSSTALGTVTLYPVYMFARGAVAYNPCPVEYPFETSRSITTNGGQEILVSRIADIMHIRGYSWTGTAAGKWPTDAELATATNWNRVYNKRDVRVVKVLVPVITSVA